MVLTVGIAWRPAAPRSRAEPSRAAREQEPSARQAAVAHWCFKFVVFIGHEWVSIIRVSEMNDVLPAYGLPEGAAVVPSFCCHRLSSNLPEAGDTSSPWLQSLGLPESQADQSPSTESLVGTGFLRN